MNALQSFPGRGVRPVVLILALALALAITNAVPGHAQTLFRQLSQDTFTNGSSQHMTEVEPGAFASGRLSSLPFRWPVFMAAAALTSAGQLH